MRKWTRRTNMSWLLSLFLILYSLYSCSLQAYPPPSTNSTDENKKAALIHYQRGLRHVQEGGQYDLAIEEYKKALQFDPNLSEAHSELAAAYYFKGMLDEALEACQFALEGKLSTPIKGNVYLNLSLIYLKQGKFDDAEKACKQAANLLPNTASVHWRLADIYLKLGKIDLAIDEYKRSTELQPDLIEPYKGLGLAYTSKGDEEEAIKYYSEAIKRDRFDPASYYNMAKCYFLLNKIEDGKKCMELFKGLKAYQDSIIQYKKEFQKQPNAPSLRLELAQLHYQFGNFDEAIKECESAMYIDPKFIPAYNNIGFIYLQKRDFEKALKAFNKTLELDPKAATAYVGLAQIYGLQGKLELAKSQLEKAIQLDPKLEEAYEGLAEMHLHNRNLKSAIEIYAKFTKVEPKSARVWLRLGVLYIQSKQFDEAIDCFKRAIEIDNNYPEAYNNLAWLYADMNKNLDEALQLAKKSVELDPSASHIDTLAWVYYKRGEYREAEKEMLRALELEPENEEYKGRLKEIRGRRNKNR